MYQTHTMSEPFSLSCVFTSLSKLSTMNRESCMPTVFTLGKEQNIVKSSIRRTVLADSLKLSSSCS